MNSQTNNGKAAAIVAYITIVGTIIAYFMNNDSKHPLASFHIRQALGIHITFYLLGVIVSWFNSWLVSAPFYLFILVLWGYGILAAVQGERNEVPLLGKQFQKWFSTID
jgi:uncharacterized membrane protein